MPPRSSATTGLPPPPPTPPPPKLSIGNPDSASASSRVFAAHPILRRSVDALLASGAPDYPMLPVFQQTRAGGFVDDARNPPLSFRRADDRKMSNSLEPAPVVPQVLPLPPSLAPDPAAAAGFVVRLLGDLEIALHRSVEAYHDLAPSRASPLVHGFNGLPGLGPWSVAGVLRVTNNKDTALDRVKVTLDFTANMACKPLVKGYMENLHPRYGLVAMHLERWRLVETKPHELVIDRLGPRESFFAAFHYHFTQVYPPSVDLIALNLNESATNTFYKLMVNVIVPRKGFFKDDTVVSLTKDIPVHLYSKPQIAEVLQVGDAAPKRTDPAPLHARTLGFPWKFSLARGCLAPSETAFLDITVGALPSTTTTRTLPNIVAVTVEIVEVVGYLRGEPAFDKSKQVRTHATQKVCERYRFAAAPPASSGSSLPLSWTRDSGPAGLLADAAGASSSSSPSSQTATLRFVAPPLATTRRDAVRTTPAAKQDPQYPAGCMNPDGRWHDAVIAHDLRVVLHVVADERRGRAVDVEGVVAVSVIGVPREELVRLVDAYPGLLEDAPIHDEGLGEEGEEELPTVF